jgi:hypothetical protein
VTGTSGAIPLSKLTNPPDATNPITLQGDEISVKLGKKLPLDIGFYNRANTAAEKATLRIVSCLNDEGTEVVEHLPGLASPTVTVPSSEGTGFKTILTEKKLGQGTFICTLEAFNKDVPTTVYERKQFYLTVTT